ncbi:hypothetical protein F5Y15DRAFT_354911 [Xylariaceae sp. FL0016]|nr:hypothetical protein F5Y15DRAFT_354911 [Xylariaceae sp. FL0016]
MSQFSSTAVLGPRTPMRQLNLLMLACLGLCGLLPSVRAFNIYWVSTSDADIECGGSNSNPSSSPLPDLYLASLSDCQALTEAAGDSDGYWRTYAWNDNSAQEFVSVLNHGSCTFSIKHVDASSIADVK